MRKFLINNLWWFTFLLAIILLVAHTLSIDKITVDNTTIILLLVLLISPFVSAIKRIKFGDFEAEIDPKEVRRIKEDVEAKMAEREKTGEIPSPAIRATINKISTLFEEDPILALAKLRMEIEKIVSKLHRQPELRGKQKRIYSLNKMIADLVRNESLSQEIANPLREVVSICNRAIHGEEIRNQDAESITDIGSSLLEMLHWKFKSMTLEEDPESIIIDPSIVESYSRARYQLTTVTPYADTPVQNIRILDQEGLDAFFEGYEEYAEFIVDLRKIESGSTKPKD